MGSYVVIGIIYGCLYALTATALVVTYTTSGIFNFAVGGMGMFMAFTFWQVAVHWGLPWPLALILVVFVAAPLMGAVIERVVRPLHGAPLGITLVVTLGLMLELLYVADSLWKPTTTRNLPTMLPGSFRIFGVVATYYEVMVVAVAIAVAALLRLFFKKTRAGITMRAVVDDRELTARSGASPGRVSQLSWMLGSLLAALAGILIAGGQDPLQHLDQFNLTVLVISGFAAAVAGRLRSLQLTVLGAMVLGLLTSFGIGYLPVDWLSNLEPVIPMALLFVVLFLLPEERLRAARFGTRAARRVTGFRPSVGLGVLFVAGCWVVSLALSPGNLIIFGHGLVVGIVLLSLVLLTGYGGQVSLCQMTLAGFGAFFMGKVLGGDSIVGLVAAFVLPAAIGAVLAVVVLRLRGIYLALATLAFAYAMDNLFFNRELGFGGILKVGRVGFHSQRGFLLEVAVLFVACAIGVLALRRGEFGRRLAAINDSEVACASIGMNITLTKVMAFTLAAGIAGLGGALYGGWQGEVGPTDFQMLVSLLFLLLIAIAGLDTVAGAFAAAIFFGVSTLIDQHAPIPNFAEILVGFGAISLGQNRSGIVGQVSDAVGMLRTWAERRGGRLSPRGVAEARVSEGEEEVTLAGVSG